MDPIYPPSWAAFPLLAPLGLICLARLQLGLPIPLPVAFREVPLSAGSFSCC